MRRPALAAAYLFLALGLFVTGRESTHGLGALWEHWWCPLPLAAVVVCAGALVALRAASPS